MLGRLWKFVAWFSFLLFITFSMADGQTYAGPDPVTDATRTGDVPYSSSVGTDIESVSLGSGAIQLHIPLFSMTVRGHTSQYVINYNSNIFGSRYTTDANGNPYYHVGQNYNGGWWTSEQIAGSGAGKLIAVLCTTSTPRHKIGDTFRVYSGFLDENQTMHNFPSQHGGGFCGSPSVADNGPDTEASGWVVNTASGFPIKSDGTAYNTGPLLTDPNGNSYGPWTDAVGRPLFSETTTTNADGSPTNTYTYQDSNGNPQQIVVVWENLRFSGVFGTTDMDGNIDLVISTITLANGQKYQFKYDAGWTTLNEIDLPNGGILQYQYQTTSGGDGDPNGNIVQRRYVSQRALAVPGGPNPITATWTLSIPAYDGSVNAVSTSTVTYPSQHSAVIQQQYGAVTDFQLFANASTSGTPLREYQMVYASDPSPFYDGCYYDYASANSTQPEYPPIGIRLSRITSILEGSLYSKKEYDYDSVSYQYTSSHCASGSITSTYTTSRGNVIEEREYGWGSGSPGGLIRKVDKTYLHTTGPNAAQYLAANIVNKVTQDTVYDGSGTQASQTQYTYDDYATGDGSGMTATSSAPGHNYTNFGSGFTLRGNVTQVKRWLNPGNTFLTTSYGYDDLGNVVSSKDPMSHLTTWSYSDVWVNGSCAPSANSYAYPTSSTVAAGTSVAETSNADYYPCTGLKHAVKGPNDLANAWPGTTWTYDMMGRTLSESLADNGYQSTTYQDYNGTTNAGPSTATSVKTIISSSLYLTTVSEMDGIGRSRKTTTYTDATKPIISLTSYDSEGRKSQVWNPSYCDPDSASSCPSDNGTFGFTKTIYDALNRPTMVIPPDGNSSSNNVTTTYTTDTTNLVTTTTVVDQAGKTRSTSTDALENLVSVSEGASALATLYQYDVLGNLLCVEQHGGVQGTGCSSSSSNDGTSPWRVRRFTYDSLSRLLSAKNPELGQTPVIYAYDADSHLMTKTDALGRVITYSPSTSPIDALGRVTQIKYSDSTPTVSYTYDAPNTNGIGRRTGMVDGSGSTSWVYDPLGRMASEGRTIGNPAMSKSIQMTYYLDGSPWTVTYPSMNVITYQPGDHGLPSAVSDISTNYASSVLYSPSGQLTGATYGAVAGGFAGISQRNTYNSRLQPSTISATALGSTLMSLSYDFSLGTQNNGNVRNIFNVKVTDHSRDQSFSYDDLNRIAQAQSSSWGAQFTYDGWGNLLQANGIPQTSLINPMPMPSDRGATVQNQLTSLSAPYSYVGGNLTYDSGTGIQYNYDAENRVTSAGGTTYTYNGDGVRVAKSTGTLYWGPGPLAESDASGNILTEYVFLNGVRIARRDLGSSNPSGVYYYLSDHLGSSGVVVNANGAISNESDYYPFGGENSIVADLSSQNYKFTGKERDQESGLDHFHFRSYGSNMGRWTKPDPGWLMAINLANPQTLNQYTYVSNNPLSFVDPFGLDGALPAAGCSGGVLGALCSLWHLLSGGGGGGGGTSPMGPSYPGGVPPSNMFLVPAMSVQSPTKYGAILHTVYRLEGPKGARVPLNYKIREFISFPLHGATPNVDGSYSTTDSGTNKFDDGLGCPTLQNCTLPPTFWQKFSATIVTGPQKGIEIPVVVEVNGKPYQQLNYHTHGMDAPTVDGFPGALPVGPDPYADGNYPPY